MSALQQILSQTPGTGHYAYMTLSTNTTPASNARIAWDTAVIIGSSIAVATSGGTKGQVTLSAVGTYLCLWSCNAVWSAADAPRTGITVNSPGSGGGGTQNPLVVAALGNAQNGNGNFLMYVSVITVTSLAGPPTIDYSTSGWPTADTLSANHCWAFCGRLA